jgi:hypothetical protein
MDNDVFAGSDDEQPRVGVLGALEELLTADLDSWSGEELAATVLELEAARGPLDAATLRVLGAWDRRECWKADGATSGAAWLRAATGMAQSTARERIRVARQAAAMVLVVAALASARLCWAKVRLFAQFLTEGTAERFVVDEEMLVEAVVPLSVEGTRTYLLAWASRVDPDGYDGDEDKREESRRVYASQTIDGMTALNGGLTPEGGIVFLTALNRIAEELHRDDTREGDAAASPRTPSQLRHDALVEMAQRALGWNPNLARRAVPMLNLTAPMETVAPDACGVGTTDGSNLSAAAIQRLVCSAAISRVLYGPQGQVLDWGRRRRLFTATQAEALFLRWGGCCFPGCDRPPSWCQIHHILEWERDLGPTDLANGAPLCSHHHHACHEGGFTIKADQAGNLTFFRPDGSLLDLKMWALAA